MSPIGAPRQVHAHRVTGGGAPSVQKYVPRSPSIIRSGALSGRARASSSRTAGVFVSPTDWSMAAFGVGDELVQHSVGDPRVGAVVRRPVSRIALARSISGRSAAGGPPGAVACDLGVEHLQRRDPRLRPQLRRVQPGGRLGHEPRVRHPGTDHVGASPRDWTYGRRPATPHARSPASQVDQKAPIRRRSSGACVCAAFRRRSTRPRTSATRPPWRVPTGKLVQRRLPSPPGRRTSRRARRSRRRRTTRACSPRPGSTDWR